MDLAEPCAFQKDGVSQLFRRAENIADRFQEAVSVMSIRFQIRPLCPFIPAGYLQHFTLADTVIIHLFKPGKCHFKKVRAIIDHHGIKGETPFFKHIRLHRPRGTIPPHGAGRRIRHIETAALVPHFRKPHLHPIRIILQVLFGIRKHSHALPISAMSEA